MARIDLIDPASAPPRTQAAYETLMHLLGRTSNMYRTAAHWPGVMGDLIAYSSHFLANAPDSALDPRLKRIVHLRASVQNGCDYCTVHNSGWARAQGVDPADLGMVRAGTYESSATLAPPIKAACAWADAVTAGTAKHDDASFERLREFFNDEQIVELTMLIAYRTMINRFVDALAVEIDDTPIPAAFAILEPERVGEVQAEARAVAGRAR